MSRSARSTCCCSVPCARFANTSAKTPPRTTMSPKNDDDDDLLTGRIPEPDDEASASERAHAKTFADLIDKTLAGRTPPAAMSADDRALLEVATVIRAASGNAELAACKRRSIVEDALRQAVGGVNPAAS